MADKLQICNRDCNNELQICDFDCQISPLRAALQSCNLLGMAADGEEVDQGRDPRLTLLGRNLDRLMRKHGLEPQELADRVSATGTKLTKPDISRIRNGETNPGYLKLKAIADLLGESMDAFRADPDAPEKMEPALDEFIASRNGDIKPEEVIVLTTLRWQGKRPTKDAWWHILQAVRLTGAAQDDG